MLLCLFLSSLAYNPIRKSPLSRASSTCLSLRHQLRGKEEAPRDKVHGFSWPCSSWTVLSIFIPDFWHFSSTSTFCLFFHWVDIDFQWCYTLPYIISISLQLWVEVFHWASLSTQLLFSPLSVLTRCIAGFAIWKIWSYWWCCWHWGCSFGDWECEFFGWSCVLTSATWNRSIAS